MGRVVSQIEFPGFTPDAYNKTLKDLESAGLGHPKGRLYHVAIQKDKGMLIWGLWESENDFNDFSKSLLPILVKNGVDSSRPTVLPVYNVLQ